MSLAPAAAEVRDFLAMLATALDGLEAAAHIDITRLAREQAEAAATFAGVLGEDAQKALAAVRLVQVSARLSSQLIDNLNANIHLRAVLTDLFLLDEFLNLREPT